MSSEITMPQLSDTMTEGTLVKWHKSEGQKVAAGEEIADVETDKATMPMEAFEDGVLAAIVAAEGSKVKVGGLIGVIAVGNEKPAEIKAKYAEGVGAKSDDPAKSQEADADRDSPTAPPITPAGDGESPRAASAKPATATVERESSAAAERDVTMPMPVAESGDAPDGGRLRVSPLAKRMAEAMGVDLARVEGSGPNGRIVQRDIEAAAGGATSPQRKTSAAATPSAVDGAAKPASAPTADLPHRVGFGQVEHVDLSKMRQVIASRLQQSKREIPHFYESIDIDVEELSNLREALNAKLEKRNLRLSLSDLVNKALAAALVEHPGVNAHFDAAKNRISRFGDVHLGIAVALPDGLIVPVLRNIDQMGLAEIRTRSADLVERARSQRLKRDELSGATFTVSTLGVFGIRDFAAIINPPEVAILAVGAAEKRAVVRDGQIAARTMMSVTLSVDHRAVDGAAAAEFLRTLKGYMERPGMMLG